MSHKHNRLLRIVNRINACKKRERKEIVRNVFRYVYERAAQMMADSISPNAVRALVGVDFVWPNE